VIGTGTANNAKQIATRVVPFGGKAAAKRGMSQHPYGLTPARLKFLESVREDKNVSVSCHLKNFHQFTALAISHAAELAKVGQKDEARLWVRFIRNSSILRILQETGHDVAELSRKLEAVSVECHPLDVPCFTNDLAAIKHCLKEILTSVEEKLPSTETVSRFSNGGSCLGGHEHSTHRN